MTRGPVTSRAPYIGKAMKSDVTPGVAAAIIVVAAILIGGIGWLVLGRRSSPAAGSTTTVATSQYKDRLMQRRSGPAR